ncbi:MAG: hypothetical protein IT548_01730 [Alphaproteobacteria bacterium]|nr:hypothetical protein [Alphaproteobacteria bacterium]
MTRAPLQIGIQEAGVMHAVINAFDIDTKFRMVKESGVFDYFDKTPTPADGPLFRRASEKYGVPLTAGGWFYRVGRDEALLEWHLRVANEYGTKVQNVQIFTEDADGRPVSDDTVARLYLRAAELGDKYKVTPCFEVHVNMWSEHFGRVARVAALVEKQGVPFHMTLDHSHVIFKIDNPHEQDVQAMRADVESGALVLDPFKPGNVCEAWIEAGYVRHAHARPAVPNGPVNVWSLDAAGKPGRGIQAPFVAPKPGEWHAAWSPEMLEPWKEVLRQLLRHHARNESSRLETISTELIPWPDYGGGAKYSLFEHSIAVAEWLRAEWAKAEDEAKAAPVR